MCVEDIREGAGVGWADLFCPGGGGSRAAKGGVGLADGIAVDRRRVGGWKIVGGRRAWGWGIVGGRRVVDNDGCRGFGKRPDQAGDPADERPTQ